MSSFGKIIYLKLSTTKFHVVVSSRNKNLTAYSHLKFQINKIFLKIQEQWYDLNVLHYEL